MLIDGLSAVHQMQSHLLTSMTAMARPYPYMYPSNEGLLRIIETVHRVQAC